MFDIKGKSIFKYRKMDNCTDGFKTEGHFNDRIITIKKDSVVEVFHALIFFVLKIDTSFY